MEKWYKKIVDNLMLYLEERQHQILPEEHQPEVHSLQFFGLGVEGATIEVLALIDWAAKYVEISHSPVPEIPGFLRRPFVKGKLVKHPIPDDLAESIHREKCVQTKAQKACTYLCALLPFWTDEATTESGNVLYGGRRRPANLMIARIRAMLNPSFGDHFKITWASITVSTAWTQSHLYYREPDREQFQMEAGPTRDLQNPLEATVEERWERYLKEGVTETEDLSFSTPSWAYEAPFHPGSWRHNIQRKLTACLPGSPISTGRLQKNRKPRPSMRPQRIPRNNPSMKNWESKTLQT